MIFILCAGKAERYGGVSKQLLPITTDGKTVLDRIIHQFGGVVVSHNQEIIDNVDVPIIYPEIYDITPHTALSTSPYWEEYNLILLGDCVFSDSTVEKIKSVRKDICFFGDIYDIWAVSFTDKELAKRAFDVPPGEGRYYGKMRQSYRLLVGLDCQEEPRREQLIESEYFYNIDDAMTFDVDTQWEYDCAMKDYMGLLDF